MLRIGDATLKHSRPRQTWFLGALQNSFYPFPGCTRHIRQTLVQKAVSTPFDHAHLQRDQGRNDDIASLWIGMDQVQHQVWVDSYGPDVRESKSNGINCAGPMAQAHAR
jgi:hypothetical protein